MATTTPTFTLTAIEEACGATVEEVTHVRGRALITHDGTRVSIEAEASPAVAGAAARMALGAVTEYVGHNALGLPVYRIDKAAQYDKE